MSGFFSLTQPMRFSKNKDYDEFGDLYNIATLTNQNKGFLKRIDILP